MKIGSKCSKKSLKKGKSILVFLFVLSWAFLPVAGFLTFNIGDKEIALAPKIQEAEATHCTASPCSFTTVETHSFVVPTYDTLTVTVWGGGGGGGGAGGGGNGNNGSQSSFASPTPVLANGGIGGGGASGDNPPGGAGGTASGGDTNTTGATGATGSSSTGGNGGDAPNGGTGGAGGNKAVGDPGNAPGGGGGGAGHQSGPTKSGGGGGGSGGYSTKVFSSGDLTVSSSIDVVIGNFGTGGTGSNAGGNGARGQVDISWTTPLIVSGTSSGLADGTVIKVAVNGTISATTGTVTSNTWSVAPTTAPTSGQSVVVFADNVIDSLETTAVTKYDGSGDISGMVLNVGVLSVGSDDAQSLALSDLDDYTCSADEDVMHSVISSTLRVDGQSCAGATSNSAYTSETLFVLPLNTLTVGTTETVTTEEMINSGTLTSTGNATYNLAGTSGTLFTNHSTFTEATSTVNVTSPSGAPSLLKLSAADFDTNTPGNTAPFGAVYADGYIYVTDGDEATTTPYIYKYDPDGTLVDTFDTVCTGNDYSVAIAFDGTTFYVSDFDDTVYEYNSSFTCQDSAWTATATPFGMVYYDGYLWIVETTNDTVYRYNTDGTGQTAMFVTTAKNTANEDPKGITYSNGSFWIADNVDEQVYEYDAVTFTAGTDFDTSARVSYSYGITSADNLIWVIGLNDDQLWKFNPDGSTPSSSSVTFEDLTINASGATVSAGAAITMANTAGSKLYIQAGTFDDGGFQIAGTSTAGATRRLNTGGIFFSHQHIRPAAVAGVTNSGKLLLTTHFPPQSL